MIDVHPPHHAVSSWRDFFIHIATICIGLLIAIGLEQGVEAIHHALQRKELREALAADVETIVQDTEQVDRFAKAHTLWIDHRIWAIDAALDHHHPLGQPEPYPADDFTTADDPAWKAARSSGQLDLLSQKEIKAYNELDGAVVYAEAMHPSMNANEVALRNFEWRFLHQGSHVPNYALLTPEDLARDRELLVVDRQGIGGYQYFCSQTHGAAVALSHGERDLRAIQRAELTR